MSLWFNVLQPRTEQEAPEWLGNMELISSVSGAEAIAQVNRLHGGDIKLSGALVAAYAGSSDRGNSRATVWVGDTENAAAAAGLNRMMVEAIEKGDSPFDNLRRFTVSGIEVFQVDGPGGKHYFYISGENPESVVWLSIEVSDPRSILEVAIKIF